MTSYQLYSTFFVLVVSVTFKASTSGYESSSSEYDYSGSVEKDEIPTTTIHKRISHHMPTSFKIVPFNLNSKLFGLGGNGNNDNGAKGDVGNYIRKKTYGIGKTLFGSVSGNINSNDEGGGWGSSSSSSSSNNNGGGGGEWSSSRGKTKSLIEVPKIYFTAGFAQRKKFQPPDSMKSSGKGWGQSSGGDSGGGDMMMMKGGGMMGWGSPAPAPAPDPMPQPDPQPPPAPPQKGSWVWLQESDMKKGGGGWGWKEESEEMVCESKKAMKKKAKSKKKAMKKKMKAMKKAAKKKAKGGGGGWSKKKSKKKGGGGGGGGWEMESEEESEETGGWARIDNTHKVHNLQSEPQTYSMTTQKKPESIFDWEITNWKPLGRMDLDMNDDNSQNAEDAYDGGYLSSPKAKPNQYATSITEEEEEESETTVKRNSVHRQGSPMYNSYPENSPAYYEMSIPHSQQHPRQYHHEPKHHHSSYSQDSTSSTHPKDEEVLYFEGNGKPHSYENSPFEHGSKKKHESSEPSEYYQMPFFDLAYDKDFEDSSPHNPTSIKSSHISHMPLRTSQISKTTTKIKSYKTPDSKTKTKTKFKKPTNVKSKSMFKPPEILSLKLVCPTPDSPWPYKCMYVPSNTND